jgi:hypothetical protein
VHHCRNRVVVIFNAGSSPRDILTPPYDTSRPRRGHALRVSSMKIVAAVPSRNHAENHHSLPGEQHVTHARGELRLNGAARGGQEADRILHGLEALVRRGQALALRHSSTSTSV